MRRRGAALPADLDLGVSLKSLPRTHHPFTLVSECRAGPASPLLVRRRGAALPADLDLGVSLKSLPRTHHPLTLVSECRAGPGARCWCGGGAPRCRGTWTWVYS